MSCTNRLWVMALVVFLLSTGACVEHGNAESENAPQSSSETARAAQDDAKVAASLGLVESAQALRDMFADWVPPTKVMIRLRDESRIAWMKQALPHGSNVSLVFVREKDEAIAQLSDVEGLIASAGWCTADLIDAAPKLRWIHVNAAGVNNCDLDRLRTLGIVLTNQKRTFGPEISDHAIGLLLALTRGLDGSLKAQLAGRWERNPVSPDRLWGLEDRTILIVGLGGIGTMIAEKAHGMGMRVIATRGSSREGPDFVDYVGLAHELPDLIGQADVVVNATPLTPETTGLFDAEMLARMQPHAYFINVGRGPTVVTDDLIAALQNGTIAGAGLDVTDPEPLPPDHPLFSAPNVIITPHIAGVGVDVGAEGRRTWSVMREQLRRFIAGDRLYSVVDLERGY